MSVLSLASLSADLRSRAVELRTLADSLEDGSRRVEWSAVAADAMRRRAARGAAQLRTSADRHDAAAAAVDRHAHAVGATLAIAGDALHHAESLLAHVGL